MPSKRLLAAALAVAAVAAGTTAADRRAAGPCHHHRTRSRRASPTPSPTRRSSRAATATGTRTPPRTHSWRNGPFGLMHMARTKDFSSWEYLGTVFNDATKPAWAAPGSFFWAPDIRYFGGRYVMYFTVTDTARQPRWRLRDRCGHRADAYRAVDRLRRTRWSRRSPTATAATSARSTRRYSPRPTASATSTTAASTAASPSPSCPPTACTRSVTPTQVTIGDRYEGSYVVYRDGWYYLMGSSMNCCAGPTTGYSVFAGRSRSPRGPFVDADGASMTESRVGGTTVDHAERQQVDRSRAPRVHHRRGRAGPHRLPRDRPRRALADRPVRDQPAADADRRIDWIDGWPRTRAGAGPSDAPLPAPVDGVRCWDQLGRSGRRVCGARRRQPGDSLGGPTAAIRGAATTRQAAPGGSVRVEADVRLGVSFTTVLGGSVVATVRGARSVWSQAGVLRRRRCRPTSIAPSGTS